MYSTLNINDESVGPGIREYNFLSRGNRSFNSGFGRPIGCFAVVGMFLTLCGAITLVLTYRRSEDKFEPFNTFGTACISIGIFITIISMVLMCEAFLTGRCKYDLDTNRSSRENLYFSPNPSLQESPMPSRRLVEVDPNSLLLRQQISKESLSSYQTFPYPIPTVIIENETGQPVFSKSV